MDAIHQGQQGVVPEPTAAASERPEWLPEKFVRDGKPDYESMARAYAELEKKQGGTPDPAKPVVVAGDPAAADPNGEAAKAAVESKGLDFGEFTTEWTDKGELSVASYEKLAAAGIPKDLVDSYIAGQTAIGTAQANATNAAAYEVAGSKAAYEAAVEWAAGNMAAADKEAYNALVNSGDIAKIKMATAGLVAQAKAGGGIEPKNIAAQSAAGDSGYGSVAEMVLDMQDPKYAKDPAFRSKVERRIASSKNV